MRLGQRRRQDKILCLNVWERGKTLSREQHNTLGPLGETKRMVLRVTRMKIETPLRSSSL